MPLCGSTSRKRFLESVLFLLCPAVLLTRVVRLFFPRNRENAQQNVNGAASFRKRVLERVFLCCCTWHLSLSTKAAAVVVLQIDEHMQRKFKVGPAGAASSTTPIVLSHAQRPLSNSRSSTAWNSMKLFGNEISGCRITATRRVRFESLL